MVNKLIGALIVVVLGLALLPLVADTVATLTQAPEVVAGIFYDTTVGTLIQAIPILYVIMIVVGVTGYFYLTRK